jgi:MFS superfamily sulfate permease-like transporter
MVPIACAGALLGWLSEQGFGSRLTVLKDKYGDLHMPLFVLPQWEADVSQARPIFVASVSIAFVAVLESLISGKIADGMTKTTMQSRQEVFATAAANIAAGVAGGLPTTAALARTALNINAGATSRLSGVFNAVFTLLIGMFALPLFGHLPLCIVAAMLFQVAVAMVDLKHLKHALVLDRGAFFLTLLVGALCVIFDPTEAIVIGGAIGLLRIIESIATGYGEVTISRDLQSADRLDLIAFDSAAAASVDEGMVINAWRRLVGRSRQSTQQSLEATLDREREKPLAVSTDLTHGTHAAPADLTDTVIYRVVGALTYIDGLRHCRRLRRFDASKHLIVSFRFCRYVDLDGLDALEECLGEVMQAKRSVEMNNNGSGGARSYAVLLAGIQPGSVVNTLLSKSVWFQRDFVDRGRVFASVEDAVAFLRQASSSSSAQGPAAQGNALPNGLSSSTDMPAGANNFSASTPSGRRAVAAAARRNIDEDVY